MAQDYGIKVSQDGYDVASATDLQLVFSSKYKTFKVLITGTFSTVLAVSGNATIDISHSLGYDPGNLVYYNVGSKRFLGSLYGTGSSGNQDVTCDALARDANKIRIYLDASLGTFGGTVTGRYYIFADPGT